MENYLEQRIAAAKHYLAAESKHFPETAIILGSGLSSIGEKLGKQTIRYQDIPEFPIPSVEGHKGVLYLGENVAVLAGRFHYYEGYAMQDIMFPIFVLAKLGVKQFIVTNASGGINTTYTPGNLVLIKDHINMLGINPLRSIEIPGRNSIFVDMTDTYTKRLRQKVRDVWNSNIKEGVYAAMSGPTYETPAEIQMLRTIGADMVGMSTVPEVTAARALGCGVLGISCITNMAAGISGKELNHAEVVKTGKQAEADLTKLLKAFLEI